MEFKEEVHGSYELVDFDDKDQCSDGSYEFLFSDLSDTLVLTEEKNSNNAPVTDDNISAQIKSLSLDSPSVDTESESEEEDFDMDFAEPEEVRFAEPEEKRRLKNMASDKLTKKVYIKDVAKTHILPFLPAKSLARCQLVCKEWDKFISTPLFAHTQTQSFTKTSGFFQHDNGMIRFISLDKTSYGVPDPFLKFVPINFFIKSSCHGLLLCRGKIKETAIYICSPANKQFRKLPKSKYYHGKYPKHVLAFEPSSLNFDPCYKVVCPFSIPGEELPVLNFDIYDSETKSWRLSDEICINVKQSDLKKGRFVYINGVAYWETKNGQLLSFDLKNGTHSVQTLPTEDGTLCKVNGEMCYVKGQYCNSTKMCVLDVYSGDLLSSKSEMSFEVSCDDVDDDVEDEKVVVCKVLENSYDDVVTVLPLRGVYVEMFDFVFYDMVVS